MKISLLSLILIAALLGSVKAECPVGDLNRDCQVNFLDMQVFAEQWLAPPESLADLNRNDEVNMNDFALLADQWHRKGVPLAINEFMASNSSCIRDTQGQYDDWLEIYNYGTNAIDIGGMYLTDNLSVPSKWRIPSGNPAATIIPPAGYLLIWADNDTGDTGLHANFKLDTGGEEIGLFDSDGSTLIDSVAFGAQTTDISYGCYLDANDDRRFFGFPSPGWQNIGAFLGDVADTKFSHKRGFYDAPFSVTIATETKDAVIYYTLDGSEPYNTTNVGRSPGGIVYTGPIPITTPTSLRAIAIKPGWKPTNMDAQTYIFLDDVIRQPIRPAGFPANWGHTGTGDYEMDPQVVNNSRYRNTIKDDLMSVPTLSLVMDVDDWFGSKGIYINKSQDGTERAVSMEFIDPSSGGEFQINCAIAMQGGVSGGGTSLNRWKTDKLSMRPRFKARTDDGTPTGGLTKLNYQLFRDSPTESFDTIVLDSVLNHSWLHPGSDQRNTAKYIQDQYVADLHNAMGGHSPHGSYAHVYINKLYWGMYYIHERPDHSWAAETFGGDKEEYDAIKHNSSGVINNGIGGSARANYNAMVSAARAVQSDPANLAKYEALCQKLDIDDFITYLLANWFCGNHDWPHKNWYATHRNHPDGRWRLHSWDAEHTIEGGNDVGKSPDDIHNKLKGNAEYRLRFADHIQRYFFNGGVLSYPNTANMYQRRMTEIDRAIVGESARWGDNRKSTPYTRKDWLDFQNNNMLNSFFPGRSTTVLGWLRSAGLYPNVDVPVFRINGSYKHGGRISPTDRFSMTATTGTIYYTIDGTDPRLPGGSVNTSRAVAYTSTIRLTKSTNIKARVLNGRIWSALSEATFAVGPVADNMRLTEIMYNPQSQDNSDAPNTEYVELKNVGADTINLNLAKFTNGIDFTFPSIELAPNEYLVVVQDRSAFEARYGQGINIAGQHSGRLNNAGERIRLEDAIGQTILDFRYKDRWRSITDGDGFSLTVIDPISTDTNSWNEKDSWRASAYVGGSPGTDDRDIIPDPGAVVINELLAHSHADAVDWIELHNTTDTAIDVGGWFLSDSNSNLMKYEIAAGTRIAPYGYIVFYEDLHFNNPAAPGCYKPFALSENGEQIYLSSAEGSLLTGYRQVEDFGASETDVSFGRYYKSSTGNFNFVSMSHNTPGSANAYPKVGPIVINEIMYNPDWPEGGSYTNDQYEYIELHNISAEPVTLYRYDKGQPWKFTDGIDFTFPDDAPATIPADGYLLVVKNPEAFAWRYPGVHVEKILGPYSGKLNNGGERLQLSMPGDVDEFGTRYYIRVDRVSYSDGSHPEDCPGGADLWPTEPDGDGKSLTRKIPADYGNDPGNWRAAIPSPGE